MEIFIPGKLVARKTGDKVWFNDSCRRAAKKKPRLFRKLKKNKNKDNKAKFAEARKD